MKLKRTKSYNFYLNPRLKFFLVILSFFVGLSVSLSQNWIKSRILPLVFGQSGDPVLVSAGDISGCSYSRDELTANLIDTINGTVVTLGDNVYPDGTASEFANCYDPGWGRHKARTKPVPGNHDYHVTGAAGYFGYFGSIATPNDPTCTSNCNGYYSYNLGDWHIVALNSEIAHGAASAQAQWLESDLSANPTQCTLAYWHKPRFSSGANHGSSTSFDAFWQILYAHKADVVLNGHDHEYERFAPQNPSGIADSEGIREFVAGMGGASLYSFATPLATSEVRNNTTWGVLKLTLHPSSYDWEFVPISGQTFTDLGSASCVGLTGPTPTPDPNATPTPTPVPSNNSTNQINIGSDDAEETESSGSMYINSSDLEFVMDGSVKQVVGMRFTGVTVPKGARITNAYLEFTADEQQPDATNLTFYGQAADNPSTFISTSGNISSRLKTTQSVAWNNIPIWTANQKYQTPSLIPVVQELVNRSGWINGNAMVFIATGTGHRTADSYEGGASVSPKLVITYSTDQGTLTPTPTPAATRTPTPTIVFTPTPTPQAGNQIIIPVTEDAFIRQSQPASNYGLSTRLEVDKSPVKHVLLKFNVTGVGTRTISSAIIRMYNIDKSSRGGDIYRSTHNNWSENTVTWNSAPATTGALLAALGTVNGTNSNPKLYDFNVASAVSGDGIASFRITSTSNDGADYVSKQGAALYRPQLILTLNP